MERNGAPKGDIVHFMISTKAALFSCHGIRQPLEADIMDNSACHQCCQNFSLGDRS